VYALVSALLKLPVAVLDVELDEVDDTADLTSSLALLL
jgi:hypothetical protein